MGNPHAPSLTFEEVLELCKDPVRRRLLLTLLDHDADSVLIEAAAPTEDVDWEQPRGELVHVHLPKLEASDVVEWDREEKVVSRGERFADLQPFLELVDTHRDALPDGWP